MGPERVVEGQQHGRGRDPRGAGGGEQGRTAHGDQAAGGPQRGDRQLTSQRLAVQPAQRQ